MKSLPTSILVAGATSALLLYFTGLIPSFGEWYSYNPTLRLQTEAFLRGEFALQPVPYGHLHDWVWGDGIQQPWGLGVPLLQLPFEIIGKLFGSFGFPERLVFLIFYTFVAAVFWTSLNIAASLDMNRNEHLRMKILNIPVFLFGMLNPAFINMIRSRYWSYEETIAFAYLWALLLFALLNIFLKRRQSYLFFAICFLSGFSPNIRPTTGIYGMMTFLIALYFANTCRIKFRWVGIPVFMTGPLFLLITNYLRFGSPLEFGHMLGLSDATFANYIVKFDNPVNWLPFSGAALELLSALFFFDAYEYNVLKENMLWQSDVPRVRELWFKPYDFIMLVSLSLAWTFIALSWIFSKKRDSSFKAVESKNFRPFVLWSFCSFIALFFFYSRWPGLLSRYLIDFAPAIVVGVVSLYLLVIEFFQEKLPHRLSSLLSIALCAAFVGWPLVSLSQARIFRWDINLRHLSEADRSNVTIAAIAREDIALRRTSGPPLPTAYFCGDKETRYEIPYNNNGWGISTDCSVSYASIHFLENPKCIAINVQSTDNFLSRPLSADNYSDKEIRMKLGLETLLRKSEVQIGKSKVITYCSSSKNKQSGAKGAGIKLLSIGWIDLRKHYNPARPAPLPPLKLISLEKIE